MFSILAAVSCTARHVCQRIVQDVAVVYTGQCHMAVYFFPGSSMGKVMRSVEEMLYLIIEQLRLFDTSSTSRL